jgi:hypothetical protein
VYDRIWSITIQALAFTGSGMRWVMSIDYHAGWGAGDGWHQGYLAAGDGPLARSVTTNGRLIVEPGPVGAYKLPTRLIRGYSGELWGMASDGHQLWLDPTTLTITDVGETPYTAQTTVGAARAGYGVWNTNVARTPNYRTTVPDPATAIAAGTSVGACQAGIFVGGRTGIAELRTPDTTPTLAVVAASGITVGQIVVGSQRRGAGALGGRTIYAHNGMQWASVALPEGMTSVCSQIGILEP